jgi:hypothetical protein
MTLTTHEARAHLTIVDTIDALSRCEISDWLAVRLMQAPLECFAPRCPRCRRVLSFGPRVDGLRVVKCACGARHFEAAL